MAIGRRGLVKALAVGPAVGMLEGQQGQDVSPWLGAEYWANPLQDWERQGERLVCTTSGGDRNVFWLTKGIRSSGDWAMSVRVGKMEGERGWAGFRVGMKTWFGHYKDAAVRGEGLNAGITNEGELFIGEPGGGPRVRWENLALKLERRGEVIRLGAGEVWVEKRLQPFAGGMALVCHAGEFVPMTLVPEEPKFATAPKPGTQRGGKMRCWFADWKVEGAGILEQPERAWGPLLFNQYTLSGGVMKMTVQLPPLGEREWQPVELEVGGRTVARVEPERFTATARFRVEKWDATRDHEYVVKMGEHRLRGVIRKDPVEKSKLVVASLTCQNDFGYPHEEIVSQLVAARPDILFFTGDQIYERNGEYGIERWPVERARLDYLRKWMLFGWAWGGLTREAPCVCLPDDHDVYHGNVWGAGGRRAEYPDRERRDQQGAQDSGGYAMDARWVNLVQETQASHLPDPVDPAPVEQGIGVYFTELKWGGVSFAVVEDRKFKSAPKVALPEAKIRNGWAQNAQWDSAKDGDVAGAQLLGERQEKWLERWAADWSGGTWMKVAVSQTIFVNLATLPADTTDDSTTPRLPVEPLGGYAKAEKKVQDHDSNGWPQTPRRRAVKLLRSCLALHLAGDQHLGSLVQYGAEEYEDGSWALCAPAISNLWPRRWYPPERAPENLGRFLDGFGNKMTVKAVANPQQFGKRPAALHERACGYSLVELEKAGRKITMWNWPQWASAEPYAGWPVTVRMEDNGMAAAPWVLRLRRETRGVVEVREARTGERVWTWRPERGVREVRVWQAGRYRVRHEGGEEVVEARKRSVSGTGTTGR